MLVLFKDNLNAWIILSCVILILYGFRLSGYLLFREIKSSSYRKQRRSKMQDYK